MLVADLSSSPSQADSSYFSAVAGDPSSAMRSPPTIHAEPYDEVESSIAAQADAIRKQRQEKRLAEERERERHGHGRRSSYGKTGESSTGLGGVASGSGVGSSAIGGAGAQSLGAGGAPMMKRRSTRAGSGDSHNGPGQGVLVGNLIGQDHANYVLMYNMLTGIRIGVSLVWSGIN